MIKSVSNADVESLRRSFMNLASLMLLMVLSVGIVGLFSVWSLSGYHARTQKAMSEVNSTIDHARQAQVHFKTQIQEWKNTLLRGHVLKDRATYLSAFEMEKSKTQSLLEELPAKLDRIARSTELMKLAQDGELMKLAGVSPQVKGDVEQMLADLRVLNETYRHALAEAQQSGNWDPSIADGIVRGADRSLGERLDAIPLELSRAYGDLGLLAAHAATYRYEILSRIVWAGVIFALSMVALMLWRILKHPALVK
jgi:Tfp pilus assembly protein PilN